MLATFRLSHLFARENGPGDIFRRIRLALGATVQTSPQGGERWFGGDHFFGKLIICPLCLSVWLAPLCIALWLVIPGQWLLVGIAVSGASVALELEVTRG